MTPLSFRLPIPGPAFGPYPERSAGSPVVPRQGLPKAASAQAAWVLRVRQVQASVPPVGSAAYVNGLRDLRAELGLSGLTRDALQQAFGWVLAATHNTLVMQLYDEQIAAACILLDSQLAEMATGEGKTHAAMLAAATAALAGVPVHVVTANAYLAARDAAALAPLFGALGLSVAAACPGEAESARRQVWCADVAYTTARDLIFDYLRDRLRPEGQPPLLRGLCMALIDEADSVLIDEARTPFVLAEEATDVQTLRRWRAALAAARHLQPLVHFKLMAAQRRALLTPAGLRACPVEAGPARDTLWAHDHHRQELVELALAALHLFVRDVDYLVTQTGVEIIDTNTGRVTPGRRWSQGLHQLIELSQGLTPSAEQRTTAQMSFQRFFPRYWHLAGTSGTLTEAASELRDVYGLHVRRVPLRVPRQRRLLGHVLFAFDADRWGAVARCVAAAHGRGRPVLVGCDSLADADSVCAALNSLGLQHQRLDARQDAREAQCVARAGQQGAITVATRMAGRGTDIRLGDGVAELGGLLVVDAQANASSRIDRQLHGRCARGGEPGEVWRLQALESGLFQRELPALVNGLLKQWLGLQWAGAAAGSAGFGASRWLAMPLLALVQSAAQSRERRMRRALIQHDENINRQLGFGGRFE
jgi:preprotein translocase subunit SecA